MDKFILMGHSFGGVTALYSAIKDLKDCISGVVGFDSWLYPLEDDLLDSELDIPVLFINSETFPTRSPQYKLKERNLRLFKQ